MTVSTLTPISPTEVHGILARHILADGFDLVFDFEKSHGAWVHDSRDRARVPRLLHVLRLEPDRLQPPEDEGPGVPEGPAPGGAAQAGALRPLQRRVRVVRGHVRAPRHARPHALRLLHRGRDARGRERAQDGLRLEGAPQPGEGDRGREGPAGPPLPRRPSTAARATRSRSRTPTRSRPTSSRSSAGRASSNPKLRFPVTPEVERDVVAAEQRALDEIDKAFAENPDDIAAIIIEPIQAEGGDNHFRPEFLRALAAARPASTRPSSSSTRCRRASASPGRCGPTSTSACEPDAVAFGKKMQVCGCMVGPRVDEEPENVFKVSSRINSTWGGGLTDMVRCGPLPRDHRRGPARRERAGGRATGCSTACAPSSSELGGVMTNARGRGLMIAFDLPTPGAARQGARTGCWRTACCCSPAACGRSGSARRSTWPPAEADAALEIVRKSLKEL